MITTAVAGWNMYYANNLRILENFKLTFDSSLMFSFMYKSVEHTKITLHTYTFSITYNYC